MPPTDFWRQGSATEYDRYFIEESSMMGSTETVLLQNARSVQVLPTQVIEKPFVIHENIRREEVEEIQPIVEVEREKTEIRQIIQPLTDKEIKPVVYETRLLATEVLPTIQPAAVAVVDVVPESTRTFETTVRQVVEKKPIIQETEKWRIIEEVQPIIYREVIVPHIIRTSRPMREVVVEAPLYAETTLMRQDIHLWQDTYTSFASRTAVPRHDIKITDIPLIHTETLHTLPVRREILTDTTSTVTTTTVANTVGSAIPSTATRSSTINTTAAPVVLEKNHTERKVGGQTVIKDTITTTTNVRPTLAL